MQVPVFDEKANLEKANRIMESSCVRPWEMAIEPISITPNTYYIGNSWVGAYVIRTAEGLLMIDSGMPGMLYLIFEGIRRMGDDPQQIKKLLISHGHYDHCGAARIVKEYSGATTYIAKQDASAVTWKSPELAAGDYPYVEFIPDCYYDDAQPVILGEYSIKTVHSPGHTPGTTSFFFDDTDADGKTVRIGMHGGMGLITLVDSYFPSHEEAQRVRDEYRSGIMSLLDERVDIAISPHPKVVSLVERAESYKGNSLLLQDSTLWKSSLMASIGLLDALEAQLV